MNMVIYNHSRNLNIAFGGVVLGELISLAHDFHFIKGTKRSVYKRMREKMR